MVAPKQFLDYIDDNGKKFIDRLSEAVAIPSVSGDVDRRDDVKRMAAWLSDQLNKFGVETGAVDLGKQDVGNGQFIDLPPAILGRIGNDTSKKTVLVYGHFDVQPADKADGWNTEPFQLDVNYTNGKMTGRGATDDKGPVLGWLNVLEAHHEQNMLLPVNMRFCFEGMEESGSDGLDDLIKTEAAKGDQGWFDHVDYICISDNYWLNTRTPTLTYGLRGIAYFHVTVTGPGSDLHSGMFGGSVFEPMTDLIAIMSKLVTSDARILIDGVYDGVKPADADEIQMYNNLDYSIADMEEAAGGKIAISDDKATVLMGRMRNPSLSLHGIIGGSESKTVIPARVTGKFSLRLVPPQTPEDIETKVKDYIYREFDNLKTKSILEEVKMESAGGMPWVEDYQNPNYEAAKAATEAIYLKTPDYTREGGSIPVTLTFADNLKKNIVLLPMGRGDDGAHSTNEKLDMENFINGSKVLGTYLYELAANA